MLRGTNVAFLTARCSQNEQGAREGLHKINQVKHLVEKGGGSGKKCNGLLPP